jgi:hypothetical protein
MKCEQMGGISTFQATTITTTSISFLFILFLEAVALCTSRSDTARVAQKLPSFPQKIYRVWSEFHPRIKQTLNWRMCIADSIRCTVANS